MMEMVSERRHLLRSSNHNLFHLLFDSFVAYDIYTFDFVVFFFLSSLPFFTLFHRHRHTKVVCHRRKCCAAANVFVWKKCFFFSSLIVSSRLHTTIKCAAPYFASHSHGYELLLIGLIPLFSVVLCVFVVLHTPHTDVLASRIVCSLSHPCNLFAIQIAFRFNCYVFRFVVSYASNGECECVCV